MKGKVGLVIGLAAGYVLGSRAGRERFEQIKQQWLKLYESDSVQKQVDKVKDLSKDAAAGLPSTLWSGVTKATKAATGKGDSSRNLDAAAGQATSFADPISQSGPTDLGAGAAQGTSSADPVWQSGPTVTNEVGDSAEDAFDDIQKAARDHDGV